MRRREPTWGSQTASALVLVGFVVVVGFVFLAGVLAGRHWPRLLPSLGGVPAPRPEPDTRRVAQPERPPAPVLSFYQDLRAPLTPQPLPPRSRPRPSPLAAPEPASPETPRPPARERDPLPAVVTRRMAGPELPGPRFTIQVAAFRTRPQAENMRQALVKDGYDAYVSEIQGPNVARYRVRVGTYPTRDNAQEAARRLAAERRLTTFVTAR